MYFNIMNGWHSCFANIVMPRVMSSGDRGRSIYQTRTDRKVLIRKRHCGEKHSGQGLIGRVPPVKGSNES